MDLAQKQNWITVTDDEEEEGLRKKSPVQGGIETIHEFLVLLPNGTSLPLTVRECPNLINFHQLIMRKVREGDFPDASGVDWNNENMYLLDTFDSRLGGDNFDFKMFQPNKRHILRLQDGTCRAAKFYKGMWDVRLDAHLLNDLPEDYTFETALASLIDKSVQAVWSNADNEKRLISIEVMDHKLSIFDNGPGMDDSKENSIADWGKMGVSLHTSSKGKEIVGKPPYLMPVFGMLGYGGPITSMHLGRHAEVSSKTKESKKVYILRLEKDALLRSCSGSKQALPTDGGLRDAFEDEVKKSPGGSFTKVDIFEPKRCLDISLLQWKLKDIYFPYIQSDELSKTGRTTTPIQFQVNGSDLAELAGGEVNGIDLAELAGGEVALANLHSCNGSEFVLQLHFHFNRDIAATSSPGVMTSSDANARLKFVYFPFVMGKESIKRILEKLKRQNYEITETYKSFWRVSVRWLGRLLPDARWAMLPFMEPKGESAQELKKCFLRVKCFIDTDDGFKATPSKTDLLNDPFTAALKNFGNKQPTDKDTDLKIEIEVDGKSITLADLEKKYQDWIRLMHINFDDDNWRVQYMCHEPLMFFRIFAPLPAKSLLRFMATSKLFLRHISNPDFKKKHLESSMKKVGTEAWHIIFSPTLGEFSSISIHSLFLEHNNHQAAYINLPDPTPDDDFPDSKVRFVDSCHGIICLWVSPDYEFNYFSTWEVGKLYLWNPTMRKTFRVPSPDIGGFISCFCFGFGYNNGDYKIVRIIQEEEGGERMKCTLFSLKDKCWKNVSDFPYVSCSMESGKYVSGCICFAFEENVVNRKIVSFDLTKEEFNEVSHPQFEEGEEEGDLVVGVVKEKLCVVHVGKNYSDIWIMDKFGLENSWKKLARVSLGMCKHIPYWFTDEYVLVRVEDGFVLWPQIGNGNISFLLSHKIMVDQSLVFIESLMLPWDD